MLDQMLNKWQKWGLFQFQVVKLQSVEKFKGGKYFCSYCWLYNAALWFMCTCVGLTEDKASHFSDQVNTLQRSMVSLYLHMAPLWSFAFLAYRQVLMHFMHHGSDTYSILQSQR